MRCAKEEDRMEDCVASLIATLSSDEASVRHSAREALEAIGPDAVSPLIEAVHRLGDEGRKEAVRALGSLGAEEAIPVLVRELEDEDSSCRWLAAEALARIGDPALDPLLALLADGPGTVHLQRGIHHVLRELHPRYLPLLTPVLDAFQSEVPEISIRGAATTALVARAKPGGRGCSGLRAWRARPTRLGAETDRLTGSRFEYEPGIRASSQEGHHVHRKNLPARGNPRRP